MAIYFLFNRHVKKDAALGEIAELLGKPKWIKEDEVRVISAFTGQLPLEFTPVDARMFQIRVFSNKDAAKDGMEHFVIYMNVKNDPGQMDKEDFTSTLLSEKKDKHANTRLKAWAISPSWAEYVKRIPH